MAKLIELKCRNCGGQLRREDTSVKLEFVRCAHCEALFAIDPEPEPGKKGKKGARRDRSFKTKPVVPMPRGFMVHRGQDRLKITRRWFGPRVIFLVAVTVLWTGFGLVWNGGALARGEWVFSLAGAAYVAVGLGLAYFSLAGIFNTTEIVVANGRIGVRHGPIPWLGNISLRAAKPKQLYAKRKLRRHQHGADESFEIYVITTSGRHTRILRGLPTIKQAVFIEQQIEGFLDIEDRPVRGEA
ncbi:MAG: hypothetical protein AAF581_22650 [Planctomycetota bacterium]